MYIDVRGPYPVLLIGFRAYRLTEFDRSVTVEQALTFLENTGVLETISVRIVGLD